MANYRKRLEALQAAMEERGLDLVVYGASPDFQYLTGTTVEWRKHRDLNIPADSVFVPRQGEPVMVIGENNLEKVKDCGIGEHRVIGMFKDFKPTIKKLMTELGHPRSIGIGEYTCGSLVLAVANYSKEATFRSAEGLMDRLRMIKETDEIEKLRRAARLTDVVMSKVIEELGEDSTMNNTTQKIEYLGKRLGASDVSFPLTAGFCKTGGDPEGLFNYDLYDPLEPNTSIAFDVGFVLDGYCSDWGRSVYYGEPGEHIKKAYQALTASVVETIDEIGGEVQRLDQVFDHIESICEREGYREKLLERLPNRVVGHQIGVEVHEDPWLRPGQNMEFIDGMVFCVEPKLWHRGEYYLRVEDMVLIRNGKAESLTKFDRELFQV